MDRKRGVRIRLALVFLCVAASWASVTLANGAAAQSNTQGVFSVVFQEGQDGYWGCADTRISQERPYQNLGGEWHLVLGWKGRVGILIRFVLSSLPPDAVIQEATLSVYADNYGPQSPTPLIVASYPVTRTWKEMEATWHKATKGDYWGLPGCSDISTDRSPIATDTEPVHDRFTWYYWDVTSAAQRWLQDPATNKGVLLQQTNTEVGGEYDIRGSEYPDPTWRPRLEIKYTLPTGEYHIYLPKVVHAPALKCVAWDNTFAEEFVDPALHGWSTSLADGEQQVAESVVHQWTQPLTDRYPLLWRNDLFQGAGEDCAVEVRLRFSDMTAYGTTVALNSASHDGSRRLASDPVQSGTEDILGIHHVVDPAGDVFSFYVSLLQGQVKWRGSPGDTEWHVVRVTLEPVGQYTLYVDGERVGSATSSMRPVSIYIGNPTIQPFHGSWTHTHVDYVRVSCCIHWERY